MMPRPVMLLWLLMTFFLLLALELFVLDAAAGQLSHMNSDMLYSLSFYRDVVLGRSESWRGWVLTPAPYFFPDLVGLFAIMPLVPDPGYGYAIYEGVYILLFAGAAALVYRRAGTAWVEALLLASLGSLAALLFLNRQGLNLPEHWLFPTAHGGGLLLGLWLFAAVCHPSKVSRSAVFLLCFAMSASDTLLLMQFLLPLWILIFLRRRSIGFASITALPARLFRDSFLGTLSGIFAQKLLVLTRTFQIGNGKSLFFTNVPKSVLMFFGDLPALALPLTVLLVLLLLGAWVLGRKPGREDEAEGGLNPRVRTLYFWLLLSSGISWVGPILNGAYRGTDTLRYMLPSLIWPLLFLPLFLKAWLKNNALWRMFWLSIALLLLLGVYTELRPSGHFFASERWQLPYPEEVRCLDQLFAAEPHAKGVSEYWSAKYVRELSHQGLELRQLTKEMKDYFWITNPAWHKDRGEKPFEGIRFAITNGLEEALLTQALGIPLSTKQCGTWQLALYGSIPAGL